MWLVPVAIAMMAMQAGGAAAVAPLPSEPTRQIDIRSDPVLRFTVPVEIGGHTRRFLVDTGAEQSGVSLELVHSLGLPTGQPSEVIGFAGSSLVPTVAVSLSGLTHGPAKTLKALTFWRNAIGADGFLGMDSLRGHVVLIDFRREEMFISGTARGRAWLDGSPGSVASMKPRHARMIFTTARAGGVRVQAILDTGSGVSVGNHMLQAELQRRNNYGTSTPIRIMSVTGEEISADYVMVENVRVGDVYIARMPIAFAGGEPFVDAGVDNQPSLLLGMDVLRQFDKVEIDLFNNVVRFASNGSDGTFLEVSR